MRRVEAAPSACILAAFLLLTLPLRWLLAALFAAGIHELCHALAGCAVDGFSAFVSAHPERQWKRTA